MRARKPSSIAVIAAALVLVAGTAAADPPLDTVFLRNGGRVRGQIMEETPDVVSVLLPDGSTRKIRHADVDHLVYAGDAAHPSAPTPPATAAGARPAQPSCVRDTDCGPGMACDPHDRCVSAASLQAASAAPAMTGAAVAPSAPPTARSCVRDSDCDPGTACGADDRCVAPAALQATPPIPPAAPIAPSAMMPMSPPSDGDGTTTKGIPALYIVGPVVLGVAWITTIAVTSAVSADKDKSTAIPLSAIPVAGPWAMLGSDLDTKDYTVPLVISGVLQGSGLLCTVLGVSIRRRVPRYGFELDHGHASIAPFVTPGSVGVAGVF